VAKKRPELGQEKHVAVIVPVGSTIRPKHLHLPPARCLKG
jgi:hypothetical protein